MSDRIAEEDYYRLCSSSIDERYMMQSLTEKRNMQDIVDKAHTVSDGSTASYYELPKNATELQHLISSKNMNAQIGEIFRECYRYGKASHCNELRGAKKIRFYIDAEIERLEKYAN